MENNIAPEFTVESFPISAEVAKGKAIASYDPRKPAIMAALKRASNCRKVTTVRELKTGGFTGNCMYPNSSGIVEGFWFVPASVVG
jgi:hypothetical protein